MESVDCKKNCDSKDCQREFFDFNYIPYTMTVFFMILSIFLISTGYIEGQSQTKLLDFLSTSVGLLFGALSVFITIFLGLVAFKGYASYTEVIENIEREGNRKIEKSLTDFINEEKAKPKDEIYTELIGLLKDDDYKERLLKDIKEMISEGVKDEIDRILETPVFVAKVKQSLEKGEPE